MQIVPADSARIARERRNHERAKQEGEG